MHWPDWLRSRSGPAADGHQITGLARSDARAEQLASRGMEAIRGDLGDGMALAEGARGADAVIHAAVTRDASDHLGEAIEVEALAVGALVAALAETEARLIYTTGLGVLGDTGARPSPMRTNASPRRWPGAPSTSKWFSTSAASSSGPD